VCSLLFVSDLEPVASYVAASLAADVAREVFTDEMRALIRARLAQWSEDYAAQIAARPADEYLAALLDVDRGVVMPKMAAGGAGEVVPPAAKPTPAKQLAGLSCGQVLIIVIIGLSVLLYLGLPKDVQDQIAGLITVLGGAVWTISKITKS
jgi:hypothetical protein